MLGKIGSVVNVLTIARGGRPKSINLERGLPWNEDKKLNKVSTPKKEKAAVKKQVSSIFQPPAPKNTRGRSASPTPMTNPFGRYLSPQSFMHPPTASMNGVGAPFGTGIGVMGMDTAMGMGMGMGGFMMHDQIGGGIGAGMPHTGGMMMNDPMASHGAPMTNGTNSGYQQQHGQLTNHGKHDGQHVNHGQHQGQHANHGQQHMGDNGKDRHKQPSSGSAVLFFCKL